MLVISNLSFAYTDKIVLHSISFSVNKGDFFAVLGPNAAGKTTLLKILTGQLDIQAGEVIIEGCPMGPVVPVAMKKKMGIMALASGCAHHLYPCVLLCGHWFAAGLDDEQAGHRKSCSGASVEQRKFPSAYPGGRQGPLSLLVRACFRWRSTGRG
ncbi:MAG: ATP-binding cassette domain-containing protein [Firmicutes bacterium]|nr:ATP-binding cassette domain-containing protein [Bacillota bacterium]